MELAARRGRVLLVDDEEAIVQYIETLLTGAGYEVRSTVNAPEAIEIARAFVPDVAFLGFVMPGMDGFILGVKLIEFLPHTKIVLAIEAGKGDLDAMRKGGYYSFDVLPAPFKKGEFLEKMKAWVREARSGLPKALH